MDSPVNGSVDTHGDIVDTRRKIVGAAEAAGIAAGGATVVSGYFDPPIAWHARWLAGFKKPARPLLVLIATPENPILPAGARAELVASLRAVDHVAEFSTELAHMLYGAEIIRIENQDRELFNDLLKLVHSRQSGAWVQRGNEPRAAQDAEQRPEKSGDQVRAPAR
jgi:hypothetical protein